MAKINLNDIANELALESGISKSSAKAYAEFVFKKIREHAEDGDEITIQSFGKFKMRITAPRLGRNIHNGQLIQIPAKHKIKFDMSRTLDEAYNKNDVS